MKYTQQTLKSHPEKIRKTSQNKMTPTKTTSQSPPFATHRLLSTQQAWEAHTEKVENLRRPSSHQRDNTVPLLLLSQHNRRTWALQPQPSQQPPPAPGLHPSLLPPLPPLPLPQLPQHPLEEQLSPELMTTLGTLWQSLCRGQALGLCQEEEAEEEEEAVEVEDHQPPFPHNNLSLSRLWPTYASWERSPESSKGKERKPTAS